MRIPRVASLLCLLASALSLLAAERCQEISDIVAAAVVSKPKMIEVLRKNRQKGTLGEAWRYDWFANAQELDKLRVPTAEQEYMFRTIYTLSFSKNLEVDMDIFRDYFYLSCKRKERGLSTIPLESIPKASLVHCWDTVANRAQFQACEEKLMESKSKAGR
jgi:hypothetical protein